MQLTREHLLKTKPKEVSKPNNVDVSTLNEMEHIMYLNHVEDWNDYVEKKQAWDKLVERYNALVDERNEYNRRVRAHRSYQRSRQQQQRSSGMNASTGFMVAGALFNSPTLAVMGAGYAIGSGGTF